jgi:hypothetical protein
VTVPSLTDWPSATVPDVISLHDIALDRDQNSVDVRLSTVRELPDLNR